MKIKRETINCAIHYGIVKNPVNCLNCQNLFCLECVQLSLKKSNKCPLCYNSPFKYEINNTLSNLLIDPDEKCIECPKCKKLFNEYDYDDHKIICKNLICKICTKNYFNEENFKKHILNDENHFNKLIDIFDNNKKIKVGIGIFNDTIQPFRFLNLLNKVRKVNLENEEIANIENEDSLIQIQIDNIPKNCYLNKDMDLYFCYSNTNINCKCCPNHICQPGNCLCKTCMDLNKKYHGLKFYHLINKAGRAARYSKHFHCYCKFIKQHTDENNNIFYNQFYCGRIQYCDACQVLDELMEYYLSPEIVDKLKNKM